MIDQKIVKNGEKQLQTNSCNFFLTFRKSHIDVVGCLRKKLANFLFCKKMSKNHVCMRNSKKKVLDFFINLGRFYENLLVRVHIYQI